MLHQLPPSPILQLHQLPPSPILQLHQLWPSPMPIEAAAHPEGPFLLGQSFSLVWPGTALHCRDTPCYPHALHLCTGPCVLLPVAAAICLPATLPAHHNPRLPPVAAPPPRWMQLSFLSISDCRCWSAWARTMSPPLVREEGGCGWLQQQQQ